MPGFSNEEQFKFLISCIRWSNNGKVDFGEVSKECNIVSKGAAAKRYERMMKAHGIAPNAAAPKSPAVARWIKTERVAPSISKKRKKDDAFVEDAGAGDDEENFPTPHIKSDPTDTAARGMVKEEDNQQPSFNDNNNIMQYLSHFTKNDNDFDKNSLYQPSSTGYSTPVDDPYTMGEHRMSYMDYPGYNEELGMDGSNATTNQMLPNHMAQYHHDSILIQDD